MDFSRRTLVEIVKALNRLAVDTSNLIVGGIRHSKPLSKFTADAKTIEKDTDRLSKSLWQFIPVSVSAIYERIEKSVEPPPGERGLATEVRAHYHNLRIRLLEQLLGARMLAANSDVGEENERIWQQFLKRHLGNKFRVVQGGHIRDHKGSISSQIDLIIVASDAQIIFPGDSDGGKAHVFIDEVVSAIMVTSNLTSEKLKNDWSSLQSIPAYDDLEKDFPFLKGHSWPLCYVLSAQSDPIEKLKEAWVTMCNDGNLNRVPQFVVAADSGFLYGGWRRWPAPQFPGNYTDADHVHEVTGIYAGLGLGWLILQQKGRLSVIQRQSLGSISRFSQVLDSANLREAVPPTYSQRFNTMFLPVKIGGVFEWGSVSTWAHNSLLLQSLHRMRDGANTLRDVELYRDGTDNHTLTSKSSSDYLRWFAYPEAKWDDRILAIEEWINHKSKTEHSRRIAVFDILTGDEIKSPFIDQLTSLPDMEELRKAVEPLISRE